MDIRTRALRAVIIAAFVGFATPLLPAAAVVHAAATPKVVVVVGPTHGLTSSNLADGEKYARIAEAHGADVHRVFHPNATWDAVVAEAQGANVLIYVGHGSGWPSPHVSALNPAQHDGMGLNPTAGGSTSNVRYYGEQYIASGVHLAANALVILNHGCYTAGSSEPGYANPTSAVAVQRVDNYAAGFLAAGAGAVIALGLYDADAVVEGLWGKSRTLDQLFMSSGAIGRYEIRADSARTTGARLHLDPQAPGEYYRAITGNLDLLTTSVLEGTAGSAPGDGGTPVTPDTTPPTAGIVDLPDEVGEEGIEVSWLATDSGSGVAACDVQVSTDAGPWADWLPATTETGALYAGQAGHGYAFRVRCTDRAGNVGPWDVTATWAATPVLAAGGFARVAVDTLNVRAAPGTSAAKTGTLSSGTIVALVDGPQAASGYTWFRVVAPVREWAMVGAVQSSGWVASAGASTNYLVPVQAPNATTVVPGATPLPSVATWYCLEGKSICTEGYPASGMYAALSPDFGIPFGSLVRVCYEAKCVDVQAIDTCERGPRGIDLYASAFALLAPLGAGRIPVTVKLLPADGSGADPGAGEPVAQPTVALEVARGYRTSLTSDYGTAVSVLNGKYVTLRARLSPAATGTPVSFFQRIGKTGDWTFLSRGRTDAGGLATWSRVVRVPAGAAGYDRYVYFRVSVPGAAGEGSVWSGAVRAVAK